MYLTLVRVLRGSSTPEACCADLSQETSKGTYIYEQASPLIPSFLLEEILLYLGPTSEELDFVCYELEGIISFQGTTGHP